MRHAEDHDNPRKGILLAVAGDNPECLRGEAALAALCGLTHSTSVIKKYCVS